MRAAAAMLLALAPLLHSCSLILDTITISGARSAAVAEQHPWGEPLQDSALEALSLERLRTWSEALRLAEINIASANGVLLLAGQVPTEAAKQNAGLIVQNIEGVRAVHNRLQVAVSRSLDSRAEDAWITTRIRADLQRAEPGLWEQIRIVTDGGVVYLLGRVSRRAAARAEHLVRNTSGVQQVVALFEYV